MCQVLKGTIKSADSLRRHYAKRNDSGREIFTEFKVAFWRISTLYRLSSLALSNHVSGHSFKRSYSKRDGPSLGVTLSTEYVG